MSESVCKRAIELLLFSIYNRLDNGLRHSFLFGQPGAPIWDQHFGVEIFYDRKKLISAALYVRQQGPVFLRLMSMGDVWSMLTDFISKNYYYIADETYFTKFDRSFAEHISQPVKDKLALALMESEIFKPGNLLTLYPLVPVLVTSGFDSGPVFLVQASSLERHLPEEVPTEQIAARHFPPVIDWSGRKEVPASWLGVRSPTVQSSDKIKAAILGAVALKPRSRSRHSFSGRYMFGGRCTLDDGATTTFGDAHTPPMMNDIIIGEADHAWLTIIATKLLAPEKEIRKQVRALEYFYRAWPLDPIDRFPWLFMALDAVFGDISNATQSVVDAVGMSMGGAFSQERLKLLMGLRASVIHGGAPDVYESNKYQKYYETYGEDPIFDLERIAAQCFRTLIFGEALWIDDD